MEQLRYIETSYADPEGATPGRTATIGFALTNKALSLSGFLWKVDRFVELSSIKEKYRESWSRLWHSNTKLGEQSLQAMGPSYIFKEGTGAHELASTQIIFEVIELLQKESQIEIADAIWQSVSNMNWRKMRCPESVSDFPEQLTVEKRKDMFLLEPSQDGFFQQKWLIDRIMIQGGFWVGRLVRRSTDFEYSDGVSTKDNEDVTESVNDQVDCAPRKSDSVPKHDYFRSVSDYQFWLSLMTKEFENAEMNLDDHESMVDDPYGCNVSIGTVMAMVAEASVMACDPDGRGSPAYLRQQRALFDIEGDTSGHGLVLTPFQKRLETIPRPKSRGMSVSWVVQPIPHVDGSEDKRKPDFFRIQETFKTLGMVRGMWKWLVQPMNRYNLV